MSQMFEAGLDSIDKSNNTLVMAMNRRVDEIRDTVSDAMHDESMMEFAGMAFGLPMLGLGLSMLGAPPAILALLSVAAPMSMIMHLTNGASERQPPEHHIFHVNLTVPLEDYEYDDY